MIDWINNNVTFPTLGVMNQGVSTVGEALNPGESVGQAPGDDLAQSQYDFRYTVFPNDLGMDNQGHYMVININVPTEGVKTSGLELRNPAGRFTDHFTAINQVSKLDTLRYGNMAAQGPTRPALSVPRQTRRIAESIALHMPQSGLEFTHVNRYEDISLSGAITSAARTITSGLGGALAGRAIDNLAGAGSTLNKLGGNPINPAIEIVFSNTLQRIFRFEFLLAPRNQEESITINRIIRTLKFHGAPEINDGVGGLGLGLTWIPPAEFDITFYNKGIENLKLPRINTCVLQQLDVDYNPTGMYATFRNGYPVAVRIMMELVELEPVHKQRVTQGF